MVLNVIINLRHSVILNPKSSRGYSFLLNTLLLTNNIKAVIHTLSQTRLKPMRSNPYPHRYILHFNFLLQIKVFRSFRSCGHRRNSHLWNIPILQRQFTSIAIYDAFSNSLPRTNPRSSPRRNSFIRS